MASRKESSSTTPGTDEATTRQDTNGVIALYSYDVLSELFKRLPARDLQNCRSVCKTWLEAADDTARVRPACFEWTRQVFDEEEYKGLFLKRFHAFQSPQPQINRDLLARKLDHTAVSSSCTHKISFDHCVFNVEIRMRTSKEKIPSLLH
jgi:hypothetical protein